MEVRDEDLVKAVKDDWKKADLGPRERALCTFAEKLTRTPGAMSAEDLAPLRDVGLEDADILDLTQVVGYFNYINRVANALGVPHEPEWGT